MSKDSVLHREEEYYGLGNFQDFTKKVFGNYDFVESNFDPLGAFELYQEEYIIAKYSQAIQIAVTAYFDSGTFSKRPKALSCAINRLAEAVNLHINKLRIIPNDTIYDTVSYKSIVDIRTIIIELLNTTKQYEGKLQDCEFDATTYDKYKDVSIYGALAYCIYKFVERLSSMDLEHDEAIRDIAIDLWLEIAPLSEYSETKAVKEIQKRFFFHLQNKLNENLDELSYPMLTRLLINLVGIHEDAKDDKLFRDVFKKYFHNLLRQKIKTAFEIDEERAQDLLPASVKFVKEENELLFENKRLKKSYSFKLDAM